MGNVVLLDGIKNRLKMLSFLPDGAPHQQMVRSRFSRVSHIMMWFGVGLMAQGFH